MCVAACNDKEHGPFTAASTKKRISFRMLVPVAVIKRMSLYVRDVTKAFVMSKTELRRPIYMTLPKEMRLENGKGFRVVSLVYGMPEAPVHWFKTYIDYHREKLNMRGATIDPCLMYRRSETGLDGVIGIRVDDTICAGSHEFAKEEERCSREFPSKSWIEIGRKSERFNGVEISVCDDGEKIIMNQSHYIQKIELVKISNNITFDLFRSVRVQYAYAAFSTVPQVLIFVAMSSQVTEERYMSEQADVLKLFRKLQTETHKENSIRGLTFCYIPPEQVEIVICIDAAFAINKDNSSQLGIRVLTRHKQTGLVNIIHYTSAKSKRVCKSALAAELFAFMMDSMWGIQ